MLEIIPLTNYKQFIDLTDEFDHSNDTTTYVAKMDLRTVDQTFFQRDLYLALDKLISRLFDNQLVVYSDDEDMLVDDRSKLYAFYHIVKDMHNGVGLIHPINIHYFGDNVAMHPGNTRLHFMYQYHNQLDVIITDYTGNLPSDKCQLKLTSVADSFFNLHGLSLLTNVAGETGPRSVYNAAGRATPYKECKHVSTANTWGLTSHSAPVLQYELTNDAVYVNGDKVLYIQDDRWWFNI